MSTVIEIASIRPPRDARKPGRVVDADGASFECWPEKLGKLQVGQRYAVEVETREWQGRPIRKIVKAQPFEGLNHQSANRTRESDLKTRSSAGQVSENCTSPAHFSTAESAFVGNIVSAFIAAGKVDLDRGQLEQAVSLARALGRCTLGGDHAQH
jgi:hypothetical protein